MEKSTISMAIFNSYVAVYQRVTMIWADVSSALLTWVGGTRTSPGHLLAKTAGLDLIFMSSSSLQPLHEKTNGDMVLG